MSDRSNEAAAPTACPRCQKGGGQPFRLAPDNTAVRVLLQCDHCHHRWSAIVPADDALVRGNAQLWSRK